MKIVTLRGVLTAALLGLPFALAFGESGQTEQGNRLADTSGIQRRWLDLPYAERSAAQKLDLYLPNAGVGPFPLIVQIHGGAFIEGDKRDNQLAPVLAALDRGYAIAAINYRLSREAHFPAPVQDVKAALRWLHANAQRYGLDAARFAVWGDSAGAHLAVLASYSSGVTALADPSLGSPNASDRVQAVVAWYGPYDFGTMDAELLASGAGPALHGGPRAAESLYLGTTVSRSPGLVARANPASYLSPDDPPLLLQAGTRDSIVPVEQSINFAAAVRGALGPERVTLRLLPGAAHGDPAFETAENLRYVLDWLDQALGRGETR